MWALGYVAPSNAAPVDDGELDPSFAGTGVVELNIGGAFASSESWTWPATSPTRPLPRAPMGCSPRPVPRARHANVTRRNSRSARCAADDPDHRRCAAHCTRDRWQLHRNRRVSTRLRHHLSEHERNAPDSEQPQLGCCRTDTAPHTPPSNWALATRLDLHRTTASCTTRALRYARKRQSDGVSGKTPSSSAHPTIPATRATPTPASAWPTRESSRTTSSRRVARRRRAATRRLPPRRNPGDTGPRLPRSRRACLRRVGTRPRLARRRTRHLRYCRTLRRRNDRGSATCHRPLRRPLTTTSRNEQIVSDPLPRKRLSRTQDRVNHILCRALRYERTSAFSALVGSS